jgi:hypothetical protein
LREHPETHPTVIGSAAPAGSFTLTAAIEFPAERYFRPMAVDAMI